MKKADNFDANKWLTENKITTQSRLNENEMQNMSSAYPQYDRFEFRKFKDNLGMKVYEKYPLTSNIKSQLPKNLMQVSPDNIETDWAKIDYTIIKGNNNRSINPQFWVQFLS